MQSKGRSKKSSPWRGSQHFTPQPVQSKSWSRIDSSAPSCGCTSVLPKLFTDSTINFHQEPYTGTPKAKPTIHWTAVQNRWKTTPFKSQSGKTEKNSYPALDEQLAETYTVNKMGGWTEPHMINHWVMYAAFMHMGAQQRPVCSVFPGNSSFPSSQEIKLFQCSCFASLFLERLVFKKRMEHK